VPPETIIAVKLHIFVRASPVQPVLLNRALGEKVYGDELVTLVLL
jgi:hypothetical protein